MNRAKTIEVETEAERPELPEATAETEAESGRPANTAEADANAEPLEATYDEPAEPTEAEAEAEAEPAAGPEAEAHPAEPRPAWLRLPALLLAAALVLTGAGAWFTLEARSASGNPAAANLALTDVGATADVTSAVTLAMNRIFSYSYDKTDVTEKAAAAVLRGSAKDSYDKLFAQVRQQAPEQKLVLTSRVSAIAVQELQNGHARLLVFLDQSAVRADNNATDSAAAQLSVTAEHTGDGWVVTELEPR
jgi:Mce-associated membrane protein